MESNKIKLLTPSYMDKFSCTGAKCTDNCCYGWRINIDKAAYKKYKKLKDKNLKKKMDQFIKKNENVSTNMEYGYISLDNGVCPFFNDSRLCDIHKEMGASYLSHTCNIYPRIENVVNRSIERSLMLSCSDAASLVLLNSNLMEFDEEEEIYNGTWLNKVIDINDTENENTINKYFWELRIFIIALLQNRNYEFQDRLIILGLFCNKLQNHIEYNRIDLVPELIKEYNLLIDNEELKNILCEVSEKDMVIQLKFAIELIDIKNKYGVSNKKYLENIQKFCEGLQLNDDNKIETLVNNYKTSFEKFYAPYMKNHQYIYENYFVNYVFRTLFPYLDKNEGVFEKYILLVIHYVIFKTFLVGISAYHEELNDKFVIEFIYSFEREIEHNRDYLNDISIILRENNFNTLSYMVMLIKDFEKME